MYRSSDIGAETIEPCPFVLSKKISYDPLCCSKITFILYAEKKNSFLKYLTHSTISQASYKWNNAEQLLDLKRDFISGNTLNLSEKMLPKPRKKILIK